ncbi:ubiquinol-cytochrome c reductase iron-sulfur subunit [Streptomyces oceani]|uniref:Cytochrome bc1 complex Rieske iron-sulfur subunit n=1 Tax=Streptomyces oceani TaxID=1075402 RepID=A0A1E7JZ17_9ACTN|nr:Rieske (2Fe-2S) protein [Streptomyces oceani]OEU96914.1 FeS-binding protein [Streptomyces oceani]
MESEEQHVSRQDTARRTVLCGTALAALGVTGAACSSSDEGGEAAATPTGPVRLGPADAVPVGGAKLYREERLVVARPGEEEFRAFSAVCTHEGCVLSAVQGQHGDCACHGSRFDVRTGEVLRGPATQALPEVPIRHAGGELTAGPRV